MLLCSNMPRWIGCSTSSVLAVVVCSLLVDEGCGQTYNVVYYSVNDCRASSAIPSATFPNEQLGECKDVIFSSVTRGYKIACASSTHESASFSSTDLTVTVDSAGCGVSAPSSLPVIGLPLPGVCFHMQGSVGIFVKWEYPPHPATLCGETLPVPSPSPVVSGDPVTWYGNKREEFWLPNDVLSPLLISPDMQVLASSRPGYEEDQWIDRIVVASGIGEHILDVSVRKNLTYFNRATLLPDAFETLDVKMEWWRSGVMAIMPPGDAQFNHWSGVSLGFGRVRHFGVTQAGGAPRREAVYVMSGSLKILILSSGAREYFIERGDSLHLANEYSHLDLEIMEIHDDSQLRGILPELWGLQEISEQTKALLKEPKEVVADDGPVARLPLVADTCDATDSNSSDCTPAPEAQTSTFSKEIENGAAPVASVEGLSLDSGATFKEAASPEMASLAAAL